MKRVFAFCLKFLRIQFWSWCTARPRFVLFMFMLRFRPTTRFEIWGSALAVAKVRIVPSKTSYKVAYETTKHGLARQGVGDSERPAVEPNSSSTVHFVL